MKLTHTKTLLASLTASAMIAGSASAAPIDFGTMDTTGVGNGSGFAANGWVFNGGNAGATANLASLVPTADSPTFFSRGTDTGFGTGTSDGDVLAAGDYTISFVYIADYTTSANLAPVASLEFTIYAWDGTTQTPLAFLDPIDPSNARVLQNESIDFTVATGSAVIGQQIQFGFVGDGTSAFSAFDTITGEFTAIPEPTSLALLGLGGLLIGARRRRD